MGRLLIYFSTLIFLIFPSSGQPRDIEINIDRDFQAKPTETKVYTPSVSRREEVSLVQWAWEMPETSYAQYPITQYSSWMQARAPLGGGVRALHFRDKANSDDYHLSGYFFFRPLVLDFTSSHLALGAFFAFDTFWSEETVDLGGVNSDIIVAKRGFPVGTGFSMLWSFPEYGIQMTGEVGYVWIRTRYRLEDVLVNQNPTDPTSPLLPGTGEIRRIQSEDSVNAYFNFTWLRGESFFNGLAFEFFTTNRVTNVELSARLSHPLFPTLLGVKSIDIPKTSEIQTPTRTNYILGLGFVKLLSIPIADMPVLGRGVLEVEPAGAVGHFTTDDGHILGAGCRVRVFGVLGFNYLHVWEQQNDAEDSDIFAVELGFQLGRSAAGRTQ